MGCAPAQVRAPSTYGRTEVTDMRERRVLVAMDGRGGVGRVFELDGTDEEFGELQEVLSKEYGLDVHLRVPTRLGAPAAATRSVAVAVGEMLTEDAIEDDVIDRGDPEEMADLLGHDIGPQEPVCFIWEDA